MAGFVQIIEFKTSRINEIEELGRPSRTEGSTQPTFRRIVATADRDHPGTYFTSAHTSGTERVAEVARRPKFESYSTIVNVQGDEPFIGCAAVKGAADLVSSGKFPIGTSASPAPWDISNEPSIVKVVRADDGRAMYFSRGAIPFPRDGAQSAETQPLQHIGVYAYSRKALEEWVSLPPHELELTERLEQLRPLAAGIPIGVAIADEQPAAGIDTEEDLSRANARWESFIAGR